MQRPMDCLRDRFGGEAANGLEAVFQDLDIESGATRWSGLLRGVPLKRDTE